MPALCDQAPFESCAKYLADFESGVDHAVTEALSRSYAGQSVIAGQVNTGGGGAPLQLPSVQFQLPVCNLMNSKFGSGAERTTNHLTQTCGASQCRWSCTKTQAGVIDCGVSDPKTCNKERAWVRGALVQLVWKKAQEVKNEVKQTKVLNLSSGCEAASNDPTLSAVSARVATGVERYMEVNAGRAPSCDISIEQGGVNAATALENEPETEQAACYLAAARKMLARFQFDIAVCEVFSRAEKTWLLERGNFDQIPMLVGNLAAADSTCQGKKGDLTQFESCLNAQYSQRIEGKFLDYMGTYAF